MPKKPGQKDPKNENKSKYNDLLKDVEENFDSNEVAPKKKKLNEPSKEAMYSDEELGYESHNNDLFDDDDEQDKNEKIEANKKEKGAQLLNSDENLHMAESKLNKIFDDDDDEQDNNDKIEATKKVEGSQLLNSDEKLRMTKSKLDAIFSDDDDEEIEEEKEEKKIVVEEKDNSKKNAEINDEKKAFFVNPLFNNGFSVDNDDEDIDFNIQEKKSKFSSSDVEVDNKLNDLFDRIDNVNLDEVKKSQEQEEEELDQILNKSEKIEEKKPEVEPQVNKKKVLDLEVNDDDLDEEVDIIAAQKEKNLGINGENSKKLENLQKDIVNKVNNREPLKEVEVDEIEEIENKNEPEIEEKTETIIADVDAQPLSINDDIEIPSTNERNPVDIKMEQEEIAKQQQEKQAKIDEKFEKGVDEYNKATGQKVPADKFKDFEKQIKSIRDSDVDPMVKRNQLDSAFKNLYKDELESALKNSIDKRNAGEPAKGITDVTKDVDKMMRNTFEYLKDNNDIAKEMTYPELGGMQSSELKQIQMDAFENLNKEKQIGKEKRQINQAYQRNKQRISAENNKNFSNTIDKINAAEGVSFNAKGIETYLRSRWEETSGKDMEERRDIFNREYNAFAKEAYQKMCNKTSLETNFEGRNTNFEIFCAGMEQMCKQNGWIDPEAPHEYFGGVSTDEMAKMNMDAREKLPKNSQEFTQNIVKDLDSKDYKDLPNYAKNLMGKVPQADNKGLDNPQIRETVGFMRALNQQRANRSIFWKIRHPVLNHREKKAINAINTDLEKKGYKDVVEYFNNNPVKSDDDPITQMHDNLENKINKSKDKCDKIIDEGMNEPEQVNNSQNVAQREGVRISVPEAAENLNELLNPDPEKTSPRVELNNNKTLENNGPKMDAAA